MIAIIPFAQTSVLLNLYQADHDDILGAASPTKKIPSVKVLHLQDFFTQLEGTDSPNRSPHGENNSDHYH